jgi:hypothetical protein
MVKCIEMRRLKWAGHAVKMDNTRIPRKVRNGKYSWKKTCGKTTAMAGRHYQEGRTFVAAEYKRMEETSRG